VATRKTFDSSLDAFLYDAISQERAFVKVVPSKFIKRNRILERNLSYISALLISKSSSLPFSAARPPNARKSFAPHKISFLIIIPIIFAKCKSSMDAGLAEHLGASGRIWEHLGASGSIWEHLGASGGISEYLGTSGSI